MMVSSSTSSSSLDDDDSDGAEEAFPIFMIEKWRKKHLTKIVVLCM